MIGLIQLFFYFVDDGIILRIIGDSIQYTSKLFYMWFQQALKSRRMMIPILCNEYNILLSFKNKELSSSFTYTFDGPKTIFRKEVKKASEKIINKN